MKQKFLPVNYQRDLFSKLHDLKQGKKCGWVHEGIFLVQSRCDLDELEDVATHYYYGLRLGIQHLLPFQNFKAADEMVQHTFKA